MDRSKLYTITLMVLFVSFSCVLIFGRTPVIDNHIEMDAVSRGYAVVDKDGNFTWKSKNNM